MFSQKNSLMRKCPRKKRPRNLASLESKPAQNLAFYFRAVEKIDNMFNSTEWNITELNKLLLNLYIEAPTVYGYRFEMATLRGGIRSANRLGVLGGT